MILAFELGLLAVFAIVAVRSARSSLVGRSIEPGLFAEAFRTQLFADPERARRLAQRAETSWVGRLATSALEALDANRDVGLEMAAEYRHVRQDAYEPLRLLRQIARGSVFIGLLAAMAEMLWARFAPQGLDALVAGVAESRAEADAVLAVAIGFAFAAVVLSLRRGLKRVVGDTLSSCDKFRERLENQVHAKLDEGWTLQPCE